MSKRIPIMLSDHAVMVVHVFTRTDFLEDAWMTDFINEVEERDCAAQQLIDQLGGHWTPRFLMQLREEINKKLSEHDNKFGTLFAIEGRT